MKIELVLELENKVEQIKLTHLIDINRQRDKWCKEYGLQNKDYQIYYMLPSSGQQIVEQEGELINSIKK